MDTKIPTMRIIFAKLIDELKSAVIIQYKEMYIAGIALIGDINIRFPKNESFIYTSQRFSGRTDFGHVNMTLYWDWCKIISVSDVDDFYMNKRWEEGPPRDSFVSFEQVKLLEGK